MLDKITIQCITVLKEEQAGFQREGPGSIDQIFTLRNIIEQCLEWQRQLYINFEKAFDSIYQHSLWHIFGIIEYHNTLFLSSSVCMPILPVVSGRGFEMKSGIR